MKAIVALPKRICARDRVREQSSEEFGATHWLVALLLALFLTFGRGAPALAQQTAKDASLPQKSQLSARDSELVALLRKVEENPGDLGRDGSGNIISLALRSTNANDRAFLVSSTLSSLRELVIQGGGRPQTGEWTRDGISSIAKLTNLVSLRIMCVAPRPALKAGVFEEICKLKSLQSLTLVAAYPERSEYAAITNLQNLTELSVSYATNFGDAELNLLTNLTRLKSLSITSDAVSRQGTNVVSYMPNLTNAIVRVAKPPL